MQNKEITLILAQIKNPIKTTCVTWLYLSPPLHLPPKLLRMILDQKRRLHLDGSLLISINFASFKNSLLCRTNKKIAFSLSKGSTNWNVDRLHILKIHDCKSGVRLSSWCCTVILLAIHLHAKSQFSVFW